MYGWRRGGRKFTERGAGPGGLPVFSTSKIVSVARSTVAMNWRAKRYVGSELPAHKVGRSCSVLLRPVDGDLQRRAYNGFQLERRC